MYAIEGVLMYNLWISTAANVESHSILGFRTQSAGHRSTLECYREGESCLITQSHMLLSKIINGRETTPQALPKFLAKRRNLDQALPSSTAALIEAKNFAGQVDSSASVGMPFSRTCLMMLCCSLAISS